VDRTDIGRVRAGLTGGRRRRPRRGGGGLEEKSGVAFERIDRCILYPRAARRGAVRCGAATTGKLFRRTRARGRRAAAAAAFIGYVDINRPATTASDASTFSIYMAILSGSF